MANLLVAEGSGAGDVDTEISLELLQQINAATRVAQSECLHLSNSMYQRLPKELRDLVYSFLCFEDRRVPIGPYYHFRNYEPFLDRAADHSDTQYCPRDGDLETKLADGKTRIDHDIYPEGDLILPNNHIFLPSHMGQDVALELLKKYYGCNSFSVCNIEGGLDDLCMTVSFSSESSRLGFVPLDHIQDLQLRLKLEHFTEISQVEKRQAFQNAKFAEIEFYLRGIVDSLGAFRTRILEFPHELSLEIVLMTNLAKFRDTKGAGEYAQAYYTNFLQSIRNMVYELLYDCEHVTVRVTHQDDSLMAFPKNYTELFNLTKEQWQYEKSKQLPNRDWTNDFWVFPVKKENTTDGDQARLRGYHIDSLDKFLHSRWGVNNIFRETVSSSPVVEGPYWPLGHLLDCSFAKERHEGPATKMTLKRCSCARDV